jgi:hypothetical protein
MKLGWLMLILLGLIGLICLAPLITEDSDLPDDLRVGAIQLEQATSLAKEQSRAEAELQRIAAVLREHMGK